MSTMITTREAIQANLPSGANIDWDGDTALVLVYVESHGNVGHRVSIETPAEAYDLKYKIATKGIFHGLRVTGFGS